MPIRPPRCRTGTSCSLSSCPYTVACGSSASEYQVSTWRPDASIGATRSPTTALTTVDFPVPAGPVTAIRSGSEKRFMW